MITSDSTLQEIAAAAYESGLRISVTFEAMPVAVPADRLSAKYGPHGVGWRWHGPWQRIYGKPGTFHEKDGWERFFVTPAYDVDDGTVYWGHPHGNFHCLFLFDGATMEDL